MSDRSICNADSEKGMLNNRLYLQLLLVIHTNLLTHLMRYDLCYTSFSVISIILFNSLCRQLALARFVCINTYIKYCYIFVR